MTVITRPMHGYKASLLGTQKRKRGPKHASGTGGNGHTLSLAAAFAPRSRSSLATTKCPFRHAIWSGV